MTPWPWQGWLHCDTMGLAGWWHCSAAPLGGQGMGKLEVQTPLLLPENPVEEG